MPLSLTTIRCRCHRYSGTPCCRHAGQPAGPGPETPARWSMPGPGCCPWSSGS